MYKSVLRPILFLISPETIHEWLVKSIILLHKVPFLPQFLQKIYCDHRLENSVTVLGIKFPNPVGLAAGFDKNARYYREFSSFGFGFIEIGTVTPRAQPGNPKPRSFRLPADKALINRMGLNNLGVDEVVSNLRNRPNNLIIGGNIGKNTDTPIDKAMDDFVYCFEKLYEYVDYFVINVSCPNTGEIDKLQDQEMVEAILTEIMSRRASRSMKKPVLLKVSPDLNFQQTDEALGIIKRTGVDGIVATNTTLSRKELISNPARINKAGQGGLSGAPLKARSTEMIRYISLKTGGKLPIIGVGGVMSPEDAVEKISAGASLVQVYTGFIYEGPGLIKRILKKLNP